MCALAKRNWTNDKQRKGEFGFRKTLYLPHLPVSSLSPSPRLSSSIVDRLIRKTFPHFGNKLIESEYILFCDRNVRDMSTICAASKSRWHTEIRQFLFAFAFAFWWQWFDAIALAFYFEIAASYGHHGTHLLDSLALWSNEDQTSLAVHWIWWFLSNGLRVRRTQTNQNQLFTVKFCQQRK